MKKITYSKQKLNQRILNQFEDEDHEEYVYDGKRKFELRFTDVDLNETGDYEIIVNYEPDKNPVYDKNNRSEVMAYRVDFGEPIEEVLLYIKPTNNNPEKPSLYSEIRAIIDRELRKVYDRKKQSEAIEIDQRYKNHM